jgi:hypothetical protein
MDASAAYSSHTPARSGSELIGRVVGVSGSQATVELNARNSGGENPTVGKFMGMVSGKTLIIGLVTDIGEQAIAAAPANRDDEFVDYGSPLDAMPLQPAVPMSVPPPTRFR